MTKEAPIVGLTPRWLWLEGRQQEILEAVVRYTRAGKLIPPEWWSEWASINIQLSQCKPDADDREEEVTVAGLTLGSAKRPILWEPADND